jgi:5-methylcytosine-specific restriction endonuclease McrA
MGATHRPFLLRNNMHTDLVKHCEYNKRWQAANPQKHREAAARWRAANREKVREASRKYNHHWRAANPEKELARCSRRRARKFGADGSHTIEEWKWLCELLGNRCVRCRNKTKLEKDHIIALINGGSDFIFNIQPLCKPCNASKQHIDNTDYRSFHLTTKGATP